jgi:tetratricopeptide (TPR) repeat protein
MRWVSLLALVIFSVFSAGCVRSSSYYTKKGNDLFASGKFAEAALNYRNAVQKDTNSAEAYYRLGLSELRQQHFEPAWVNLSRAFDLSPQRDDIRIEVGNFCLAGLMVDPSRPAKLYNRLKEISNQLLAVNPNSFPGLRFKGFIAFFDHRMDEAVACFRHAHQLKPDQTDVAVSLVDALFQINQEQEAERVARSVIARTARNPAAYDALYAHYTTRGRAADAEAILKLKMSNNPAEPSYVIQLCRFYWSKGRQDDASGLIEKMLASPDQLSRKRLMAGDFYGSVEQWGEARQQFEEGIRIAPASRVAFQKRIADVLLAQGKRAEAAGLVDEILKQAPGDVEAIKIRAGLKLDSKDPRVIASAVSDFKNLLRTSNGNDPELHYLLGQALVASGDLAGARVQLQEAIREQPNYIAPRSILAQVALNQRKPDEAINWCNEVIALDPQNARSRLLKTIALRTSGQYDQGRREVDTILRASPKNAAALLQLGLVEIERKNFSAAAAAFMKLQELNRTDAAGGVAAMYVAEGQPDKAFDLLKKTASQFPDSVLLHDLLATLAVTMQKYDVAIDEFRTLLAKDPHSTTLYIRMAEAYRLKGDLKSSVATLERAQKAMPDELMPTLVLASTLESTSQVRAVEQYRRALEMRPDDPDVLNNLAYLIVETNGNLDEALRLAQRAVQKVPDQANFADTMGWIYFKKNMPDSALQVFNSLVKKKPEDPTFRYHLGATLLQKGDKQKARVALQAALLQKPGKEEADKIRGLLAQIGW